MSRSLHIQYFAKLREERGQREEAVQTEAATAGALYDELRALYGFSLEASSLRVAVNEEFQPWDHQLQDGDTVVFLQPASGG